MIRSSFARLLPKGRKNYMVNYMGIISLKKEHELPRMVHALELCSLATEGTQELTLMKNYMVNYMAIIC